MGHKRLAANPYTRDARRGLTLGEDAGALSPLLRGPRQVPRDSAGSTGPGLTAGDIDSICRQHYLDGYAAAERDYEPRLDAALDAKADAFDEGAAAQDELNTSVVLDAARRRLIADVYFPVREALEGPKARRGEWLERVRDSVAEWLDELMEASVLARGEASAAEGIRDARITEGRGR